ncbi:transposase [Paraburkholderia ultramafica]|uniref:transposase n=1 Tax=Paraburkholderia ultramafica TaxID=1544867 RepID=UPI001582478A
MMRVARLCAATLHVLVPTASRHILDALLWIFQTGEKWHRLPASYGPPQTCYMRFIAWRKSGAMAQVIELLDDATD